MAYLVEPESYDELNWDLNLAYETRIHKNHSLGEKLDNLLLWIRDNVEKFRAPCDEGKLTSLHTDFVSYRGLLTTIMCSVFETKDSWIMGVTKYRDTYYMCQYETAERIQRESNMPERLQRASAWGYKFEQFLTAPEPGGTPTPEAPTNEKEEFCSVVRTRLGKSHSLVYGAEVDAVDAKLVEQKPHLKHSTQRYVEMKTSRRVDNQRQHENLIKFKAIKWWAQSHLIGIPRVICGFRNDDGIVESLESYNLPDLVKMGDRYWKPEDMLTFLDNFLQFVKRTSTERRVTLFEYVPRNRVIKCMDLPSECRDFEQFQILPPWYIAFMEKQFK